MRESYRLLRLVISILFGYGLFTIVSKGIETVLASTRAGLGALGFAVGLGSAYVATRKLKKAGVSLLRRLVVEKYDRMVGAAAGFLRALAAVSALIAFLQMTPWIPGVKSALEGSLIGRVVGEITRPVEKSEAGQLEQSSAEPKPSLSPNKN